MSDSLDASPTSASQRLTLSSPDAFLAAVPHLLGFPPRDSVVLVGLSEDGSGRESIRLVQRFDRPEANLDDVELTGLARAAAAPMRAAGSSSVIVAVFGEENPTVSGVMPSMTLVDALVEELDDAGMWVKDTLYTDGASRWSYGCDNPDCCPIAGAPISDELRTMMAAEFAGVGAAMAPSRQSLVDDVAREAARVQEVAKHLPAVKAPTDGLEAWRDRAIAEISSLRSNPNPSPAVTAQVLTGLADVRVRDTALWELAQDPEGRDNVISALTHATRSAPNGYVAPVATALAIQQWTQGDGARANACLDRSAGDDPSYSLAQMVGTAIGRGLPPSSWTDVMRQLDRATCRHGNEAPNMAPRQVSDLSVTAPSPSLAS